MNGSPEPEKVPILSPQTNSAAAWIEAASADRAEL
jgi:hypothetical protein